MDRPHFHPFRIFLATYAVLIAFGSLHPFSGWQWLGHWSLGFVTAPLPRYLTRTDLITNLLVYLPLGYALALSFGAPRRGGAEVFLATAVGALYSLALESLQQLLPGRIASNLDVFLNILGSCAGALLSLQHHRWLRTWTTLRRWRWHWFQPTHVANAGLGLLALWLLAQFSLLPFPGAGWLALHLRPLDAPFGGIERINFPWLLATFLEMATLGAFTACLLKPGRYVRAILILFVIAFTLKLLAAMTLLKMRVLGGVLSLETLLAFFLAYWLLLLPLISRWRRLTAGILLALILYTRLLLANYLFWPDASLLNIVGLAKAIASLWPWAALIVLLWLSRASRRGPL